MAPPQVASAPARSIVPTSTHQLGRAITSFVVMLRLTRAHNCVGAALATQLGAHLAWNSVPSSMSAATLGAMAVGLSVAASNVFNDYRDVAVDSFGKAHRPIPAGQVTARTAGRLTVLLAGAALALASSVGAWSGVICFAALFLGLGYSYSLKSTALIGNAVVALLSASTVWYGGFVVGQLTLAVGMATGLVFLFVFAREILGTIADRDGDARGGVRTLATRAGPAVAHNLFDAVVMAFALCAVLPGALGLAPPRYLWATVPLVVVPILGVVALLRVELSAWTLSMALGVTKLLWFLGLLCMLLLR